jgi:hypothetical protein
MQKEREDSSWCIFSPFILHSYRVSNISKLAVFEDQKVVLLSNLKKKEGKNSIM